MESKILKDIHHGFSRGTCRLFRNNVGQSLTGVDYSWAGSSCLVRKAEWIRYGLCVGSSDLIGWRTLKITQDMVGQNIAQFVAVEVKSSRGRVTQQQKSFLDLVNNMGGRAGVARSLSDARNIIGNVGERLPISKTRRYRDCGVVERTQKTGSDRSASVGVIKAIQDE